MLWTIAIILIILWLLGLITKVAIGMWLHVLLVIAIIIIIIRLVTGRRAV